jgi:hypothetical protein
VIQLRDRVFSFRVASKDVGFYIIQKRVFLTEKFKCYFHLWSDGGPNWRREFHMWQQDSDQQWTLVSPSKRRFKLGMNALNLPAPKPALKHTTPINKKLVFAEKIQYEAKKGYAADSVGSADLHVYNTVSTPVISFGTTIPIQQGKSVEEDVAPVDNKSVEDVTAPVANETYDVISNGLIYYISISNTQGKNK